MLRRDIVVVGASAGGVEALYKLAGGLPADFAAAVFIVLHVSPQRRSLLPELLSRRGPLPATLARNGEPIEHGRIYIAPPDLHLLVREGHVELSHGPRENSSRPAIDPLFRSVAQAYGPRVVGVVLSGLLGDGSVGLVHIKLRGGIVIVQDPADARHDSMPRRAIQSVDADYVLPAMEIPRALERLTKEPIGETGGGRKMETVINGQDEEIKNDLSAQAEGRPAHGITVYSCPECGGVLWQSEQEKVVQFQCHVGHRYSPDVLLVEKSEALESALYASLRLLTEKAILTRQLAAVARASGDSARATRIEEKVEVDEKNSKVIHDLLLAWPNPTAQASLIEDDLTG